MNKVTILSLIVICLGIVVFIVSPFFATQKPETTQKSLPPVSSTPPLSCSSVTVLSPKPNQQITTPMKVQIVVDNRGKDCHWTVFEGQAGTMEIKDADGKSFGKGILSTSENWMTTDPIRFTGEIPIVLPKTSTSLTLFLYEENPGGNSDKATITIPLKY